MWRGKAQWWGVERNYWTKLHWELREAFTQNKSLWIYTFQHWVANHNLPQTPFWLRHYHRHHFGHNALAASALWSGERRAFMWWITIWSWCSCMADGTERPIGFTSRALNTAKKNSPQLDKEGPSVMFKIKCFHKYIKGRKFTILTDHKPLLLFSKMKAVPQMASPRIQHWAVTLRANEYTIMYKEGKHHH